MMALEDMLSHLERRANEVGGRSWNTWYAHREHVLSSGGGSGPDVICKPTKGEHAAYIAAVNPSDILDLIDAVRSALKEKK